MPAEMRTIATAKATDAPAMPVIASAAAGETAGLLASAAGVRDGEGAGAGLTTNVIGSDVAVPRALAATIRNVLEPAAVGAPANRPVAASRVSPGGRASPVARLNVGAGAPDAVKVYEYAVPAVAVGGAAAVNTGGACTVNAIGSDVSEPAALVATTRNVPVPAVVGVPESSPVVAFRVKPAGRASPVVRLNVGAGEPDAVNVYEYDDPLTAAGGVTAVNTGLSCTVNVIRSDVALPAAFVATIRNVLVPDAVGMPASSPVAGYNVRPAGRVPPVSRL